MKIKALILGIALLSAQNLSAKPETFTRFHSRDRLRPYTMERIARLPVQAANNLGATLLHAA